MITTNTEILATFNAYGVLRSNNLARSELFFGSALIAKYPAKQIMVNKTNINNLLNK